jgi:multiple sugar transport system ATP-binding protein
MASVRFDHVSKAYDGAFAVKDLSLEIADGELLVLVGPSGCGKTTSLRMLAGLEDVSEGQIYIGERQVDGLPPRERDVAMVFQSYALYPHMSVYDNLAFGLSLGKMPKREIEGRVRDVATTLGIEALLTRKPRQLSGGQRQRVALGRAIVRQPAVFLLDEPLSNLDAKLRVQTRAEISKLHQQLGATFVYVTHDQVEAMTMAQRIAVMRDGTLQQVGTPRELYDAPANMFVAGFIGSPEMNFVRMTVVDDGGQLALATDAFKLPLQSTATPQLRSYAGRQIVLGIRPEDLHDAAFRPSGIEAGVVEMTVEVSEMLGNEVFLHLRAGSDTLLARVDPRTSARPGSSVAIAVDLDNLYTFDPETEQTLTSPCRTSV